MKWSEFKDKVQDAYRRGFLSVIRYARYGYVKSRGTGFCCCIKRFSDGQEERIFDGCDNYWNGTKKEFLRELNEAGKRGEVLWFGVGGGWDGSRCLRDYMDGDYDPWIGEWDFTLSALQLWDEFGWSQPPAPKQEVIVESPKQAFKPDYPSIAQAIMGLNF